MPNATQELTMQQISALSDVQLSLSLKFNAENGPRQVALQIVNHLNRMITAASDAKKAADEKTRKDELSIGLNERNEAFKKANSLLKQLDELYSVAVGQLEKVKGIRHDLKDMLQSAVMQNIAALKTTVQNTRDILIKGFSLNQQLIDSYEVSKDMLFQEANRIYVLISAVGTEISKMKRSRA